MGYPAGPSPAGVPWPAMPRCSGLRIRNHSASSLTMTYLLQEGVTFEVCEILKVRMFKASPYAHLLQYAHIRCPNLLDSGTRLQKSLGLSRPLDRQPSTLISASVKSARRDDAYGANKEQAISPAALPRYSPATLNPSGGLLG
ncbi:hypothetical protein HYALB_00010186 [Hymenoscyphus albidus]|uniref:Uncharacterized protein n=1 Tax=Hymenoscyphus albidus TaxID=595503 RepID=A0A9N9LER3_9HELO|nr:hypothetical protein HYALB_00010186 [Hymenoscyphus albidus]